jgi:hypothetical protein
LADGTGISFIFPAGANSRCGPFDSKPRFDLLNKTKFPTDDQKFEPVVRLPNHWNDWNVSNSLEPTIAKSDFSFAFLNVAILTIA